MADLMQEVLNPGAIKRDPDFPHAPADWSREAAERVASAEGLELTAEHWELVRALQEFYHRHEDAGRINVRELHDAVALLLDLQSFAVPVRRQQRVAREETADGWIVNAAALVVTLGHDVEQGLERRAGVLDAAVLQVTPGDALLGLDDVVDAVDEDLQVLGLGAQDRR
jgi:hypothetical protein